MREECGTCCEPFNKSNRSKIVCAYCPQFSACASCTERYLLDSSEDAHCMSCRKTWHRSFLASNFTQKFMNKTYKEHRENVLLEREKALMPETQNFVEIEIQLRKLQRQLNSAVQKRTRARNDFIRSTSTVHEVSDYNAGLNRLDDVKNARDKLYSLRSECDSLDEKIKFLAMYRYGHRDASRFKRVFVRACPAADCKGFLNSEWKCGICEQTTCKDCHEIRSNDDHACDPNSVETATLLARDSRPCPSCACMIFKIDGCDQMWCTRCHTAFSWRLGTIVTSIIHNPHYYDYLRTNGNLPRNPLDVPCGGIPDWVLVRDFGVNHGIYRLLIHGDHVLRPMYGYRNFDPGHNRELRIKFMMNELTSEKFKSLIQRDEKCRQKNTDIYNVLEMFSTVMTDLLQKLVNDRNSENFTREFTHLVEYVNTSMAEVSSVYSNCRVPLINTAQNSWNM